MMSPAAGKLCADPLTPLVPRLVQGAGLLVAALSLAGYGEDRGDNVIRCTPAHCSHSV